MSKEALKKNRPIFISCSTTDLKLARNFREALDQLPTFWGFIARDEPRTFLYPSEKIAQMLEHCDAYIILYTQSALESPMVNQEFGFFYHRYRAHPANKPPIFLVKSKNIQGQIDGFAWGREAISLESSNPGDAISDVLWGMEDAYSIKYLEIKCEDHFERTTWPSWNLCNDCIETNSLITWYCSVCGEEIQIDPLTFLRS